MLSRKQVLILFLVCSVAFGAYFVKPWAVGYDSYYFLQPERLENEVIGSKIVFQAIGGNILIAKMLLFACLYAATLSIACLGCRFCPKNGWKAGYLVFLSPIFLLDFLKIESEAIAYPILFLSLYFLLKDGYKNKAIACGLIAAASLFWPGSVIYFVAAAVYLICLPIFIYLAIALLPFIPLAVEKIRLGTFLPNPTTSESAYLGAGITFHWALLFFGGLGLASRGRELRRLLPLVLFFGALAFLNAKFAVHLSPFLAVGACFAPKRLHVAALDLKLPKPRPAE